QRLLLDIDDVVLGDAEGRNVDLPVVHQEVAVADELAGLAAGTGQTGAVHDVVQTGLEQAKQVVTGLALEAVGLFVVPAELLLHHAVGEASLLLLLQLEQVFALLDPRAAVLAGRVGATFERLVAADQVDAEATALARSGSGVTGHCGLPSFPVRRDAAWADGSRCAAAG